VIPEDPAAGKGRGGSEEEMRGLKGKCPSQKSQQLVIAVQKEMGIRAVREKGGEAVADRTRTANWKKKPANYIRDYNQKSSSTISN